jgi:uncharacterized protein
VMPLMLSNVALWHSDAPQVVIVGQRDAADTATLEVTLARTYAPGLIHIPITPGGVPGALASRLPWLGAMTARDGRATAYLCRQFACQEPTTEPETFARQLREAAGARLIR